MAATKQTQTAESVLSGVTQAVQRATLQQYARELGFPELPTPNKAHIVQKLLERQHEQPGRKLSTSCAAFLEVAAKALTGAGIPITSGNGSTSTAVVVASRGEVVQISAETRTELDKFKANFDKALAQTIGAEAKLTAAVGTLYERALTQFGETVLHTYLTEAYGPDGADNWPLSRIRQYAYNWRMFKANPQLLDVVVPYALRKLMPGLALLEAKRDEYLKAGKLPDPVTKRDLVLDAKLTGAQALEWSEHVRAAEQVTPRQRPIPNFMGTLTRWDKAFSGDSWRDTRRSYDKLDATNLHLAPDALKKAVHVRTGLETMLEYVNGVIDAHERNKTKAEAKKTAAAKRKK